MTPQALAALLENQCELSVSLELAEQLSLYLNLLLRWNARTNLTAIREPEQIILRHFGESLQCARALPAGLGTVLDFGSGAGFPGAICALDRPELAVTLTESQGKKAAFLQEVCRVLDLSATVVASRVEALPPRLRFDAVTLRAVDDMSSACKAALSRVAQGGWLVLMTTREAAQELGLALEVEWQEPVPIRGSREGVVALGRVRTT